MSIKPLTCLLAISSGHNNYPLLPVVVISAFCNSTHDNSSHTGVNSTHDNSSHTGVNSTHDNSSHTGVNLFS